MESTEILRGHAIVVADRGFVYVGDCVVDSNWCVISNARNIRKWGTTKGLGELATDGPTDDTVIDAVGTVRIPMPDGVKHLIDTEAAKWTR